MVLLFRRQPIENNFTETLYTVIVKCVDRDLREHVQSHSVYLKTLPLLLM